MCKCTKNNTQNDHQSILETLDDIQEHLEEIESLLELYACRCSQNKTSCNECETPPPSACNCDECTSECNCDL